MKKSIHLFLDIETVPQFYYYNEMPEPMRELWDKKWQYNKEQKPEELYQKAGVYSEFAKVVCICFGFEINQQFLLYSIYNENEKIVLQDFNQMIRKLEQKGYEPVLCAHNGKEFDFPFLCRRMIVHGINLPETLDISGKKPWEIKHQDTMEMWKFGDYKNYTGLNLLAYIFNLPTPKDEIEGSDVARVYYEEKDLDKIVRYCKKDVITVARIWQKLKGLAPLQDEKINDKGQWQEEK